LTYFFPNFLFSDFNFQQDQLLVMEKVIAKANDSEVLNKIVKHSFFVIFLLSAFKLIRSKMTYLIAGKIIGYRTVFYNVSNC